MTSTPAPVTPQVQPPEPSKEETKPETKKVEIIKEVKVDTKRVNQVLNDIAEVAQSMSLLSARIFLANAQTRIKRRIRELKQKRKVEKKAAKKPAANKKAPAKKIKTTVKV